jgi:hypothetical protein
MGIINLICGANMSPSDLINLTDAKDLVRAGHYTPALEKLRPLLNSYPSDEEIKKLILQCAVNNKPYQIQENTTSAPEVTITIKNPGCMAMVLFLAIVAAIMVSFFLIFYVFGFTLRIRMSFIQYLLTRIFVP